MQEGIVRLLSALLDSRHFEDAATVVVEMMLRVAEEALAASRFAGRGRLLRGLVHLRPGEGYTSLAVVEARNSSSSGMPAVTPDSRVEKPVPLLASVTAWHSVVEHRCPIFLDIHLGTIQPHLPGATMKQDRQLSAGGAFNSQESRQRFLGRQASHVCILPLRAPGGAVDGMISLEAECPPAMGLEFIWAGCIEQLQAIANIAAAFLVRLPSRPAKAAQPDELLPVVGSALANLMPILRVFAQQDETILISGPTGAGKSRLARWCHAHSAFQEGPFEVLDLITIPEELQMAELFGWKKGAFTGAIRDSQGAITRAEGGTLFIDEIDKLTLKTQAGLLHVLEERTYRPLGEGQGEHRAKVRFIIGTNADLEASVRAGRFREDLYYRLNVLPIRLPPLQERQDEICPWARYMAQRRHRERSPTGEVRFSPAAERLLTSSPWPGNLRQLDNIIRRAYALALVSRTDSEHEVFLDEKHITQALRYEIGATTSRPLVELLSELADAFVSEAQRRGQPIDMDLLDGLRGLVIASAVRQVGREETFRLFDREKLVASRNHHRVLRRELERADTLCKALGSPESSPLAELAGVLETDSR